MELLAAYGCSDLERGYREEMVHHSRVLQHHALLLEMKEVYSKP
jgi:hypothetical protein